MSILYCRSCRESYGIPEDTPGPVSCPQCQRPLQSVPVQTVPVQVKEDRKPRKSRPIAWTWAGALAWVMAALLANIGSIEPTAPLWIVANAVCACGIAHALDRLFYTE